MPVPRQVRPLCRTALPKAGTATPALAAHRTRRLTGRRVGPGSCYLHCMISPIRGDLTGFRVQVSDRLNPHECLFPGMRGRHPGLLCRWSASLAYGDRRIAADDGSPPRSHEGEAEAVSPCPEALSCQNEPCGLRRIGSLLPVPLIPARAVLLPDRRFGSGSQRRHG